MVNDESSITILLVEDDDAHAELIRYAFTEKSIRIVHAQSIADAQARLSQLTPDLLLVDYRLPDGDGFALIPDIPEAAPYPVIIMTSQGNEQVAVDAMKRGALDYVVKSGQAFNEMPHAVFRALREWHTIQDRKEARNTLRVSEERFRNIFLHSAAGITVSEIDGKSLVDTNPALQKMLGYTAEEINSLTYDDFTHPDDIDSSDKMFNALLEGKQDKYQTEKRFIRKDGQIIWVYITVALIRDDENRPQFVLDVVEDITARKTEELALIEAKEKAEELSRLQSAFLTNMSHEIRTPLTAILGFNDILKEELPNTYKEITDHIDISSKRLLETLNSLLDLAKLESNTYKLNPQPLDIGVEIEETIRLFSPEAQKAGLWIRFRQPPTPVQLPLDRGAFQRILNNLISNAIKYTCEGGISINVEESTKDVRIFVRDTGVGIEASFMPRLFDAFHQESQGLSRSFEGSGIGLALTRQLVTLMNGSIDVLSEKGNGSIFTVRFPKDGVAGLPGRNPSQLHLSRTTENTESAETKPFSGPPQKRQLLLVEDNEATRSIVSFHTRNLCDIDAVCDGEQGLFLARKKTYDLILLDISLGRGKDGIAVLHELRKMPAYTNVPILALTAHAFDNQRDHFLSEGFTGYLRKPFKKEDLIQAIYLSPYIGHSVHHIKKIDLDKQIDMCRERSLITNARKEGDKVLLNIGDLHLALDHNHSASFLEWLLNSRLRSNAA